MRQPFIATMSRSGPRLPIFSNKQTGDVLELGSGTGQHAVTFARRTPQLAWWPSDIYSSHLASIAAWRKHEPASPICARRNASTLADPDWNWRGEDPGRPLDGDSLHQCAAHLAVACVAKSDFRRRPLLRSTRAVCSSMAHSCATAHTLRPATPPSMRALRAENPEWGVRDIADLRALADEAGLSLAEITAMPANNLVLAFAPRASAELIATTQKNEAHGSRTDPRHRPSRPCRNPHARNSRRAASSSST